MVTAEVLVNCNKKEEKWLGWVGLGWGAKGYGGEKISGDIERVEMCESERNNTSDGIWLRIYTCLV